jgi:putative CocE/NonD family hydrolase
MADYMALTSRPDLSPLQYLIADSTDHKNYSLEDVPITPELDHDSNDEALARLIPKYLGPALEFFDAFLLRMSNSSTIPRVRWHLAHDGWQESETWPPPGARELRLYLGDASSAAQGPKGGSLRAVPQPDRQTAKWVHDPENLVPSAVENPFAFLFEYPDEQEIERRDDVMTFTSEPLDEPVDLAGPISAHLAISTNGSSMHLFARLLAVSPRGEAHMIVRGQTVASAPRLDRLTCVDLSHTGYRVRAAPAAAARGLERLPALSSVSGYGGEPVACGPREAQHTDDRYGRRGEVVLSLTVL